MAGLGAFELCARLLDDVLLLASVWRVCRRAKTKPSTQRVLFAVMRVLDDERENADLEDEEEAAAASEARERRRAEKKKRKEKKELKRNKKRGEEDEEEEENEEAVFGGGPSRSVSPPRELSWLKKSVEKTPKPAKKNGLSTWLVDELSLLPVWGLLVRATCLGEPRPWCWSPRVLRSTALSMILGENSVMTPASSAAYMVSRCALRGALDGPFFALLGQSRRQRTGIFLSAYRITLARPFEAFAVRTMCGFGSNLGENFRPISRRAAIFAALEASLFDGALSTLAAASALRLRAIVEKDTTMWHREVAVGVAGHFLSSLALLPLALASLAGARLAAWLLCGSSVHDARRREKFERNLERYIRPSRRRSSNRPLRPSSTNTGIPTPPKTTPEENNKPLFYSSITRRLKL